MSDLTREEGHCASIKFSRIAPTIALSVIGKLSNSSIVDGLPYFRISVLFYRTSVMLYT